MLQLLKGEMGKMGNYFNSAKIDQLMAGRKMAYSISEAAEMIGVSPGHLRNENRRKKLMFSRSGRRILILHTELLRYLQAQIVETGE